MNTPNEGQSWLTVPSDAAFHPPTALPGLSQVVRAIANSPEWFIALEYLEEADQVSGGSMHFTCCFVINSCTCFMDSFGKFFFRTFWIVLGTMLFFLGRRESNAKYFNLYIYFHRLLSNCSHLLYSCLPPYSRAIAQSNPDSGAFAVRVGTGSTASGSWPTVALGRCSLQRFGQSQQHLAAGACDPDMCVAMKGSPATQLGWQRYWSWYYEVAT